MELLQIATVQTQSSETLSPALSTKTVWIIPMYEFQTIFLAAVDIVLSDVLPKSVYFRLNPNMSADIPMDEGRIEMLEQIQFDARRHLEKADESLKKCARVLLQDKTLLHRSLDKFRVWYKDT